MPKPLGRTAKRRGLPAIGLAAVACVGCCALPLLAAGGILGGGLALMHDSCLAPLAILMLVVGVTTLVIWILRRRRKADKCGDGADCACAADSKSDMVQANVFWPGP